MRAEILPGVSDQDLASMKEGYRRPATIPFPADNPYTAAKAELGKILFFDPRLSRVEALSCASCHNPSFGWEDGRPLAIGDRMEAVPRHSPTVLNAAWGEMFFWDGRAGTLEEQALGPIQAAGEMNMDLDALVERLQGVDGYRERFETVFPGEGITKDGIAKAIATFERTVVSNQSPFDDWIEGREDAISDAAKRGFVLFNTTGGCVSCHSGWRLTDDSFHDIGLPDPADLGRGALFPDVPELTHAFKTPSLRNIDQRAPYMHDGSLPTLEAVMRHYVDGIVERPSLSPDIRPAPLSDADIADVIAFMRTLSGDERISVPVLPF